MRQTGFVVDAHGINVYGSCFDLSRDAQSSLEIFGEDGGGETWVGEGRLVGKRKKRGGCEEEGGRERDVLLTIFSIIRNLNCLFIILYHKQRNCRAETFLIVEICIFLHIFKNHGSHSRGQFAFIVDVAVNGFGAFGDGIR